VVAANWIVKSTLCLMLISTTSCGAPKIELKLDGGSSAANAVACAVFDPIYLEEQEIMDLTRKSKEKIAGHNAAFEKLCGEDK